VIAFLKISVAVPWERQHDRGHLRGLAKAGAQERIFRYRRAASSQIDGFISIERFESLTELGKILSLSFFRDEAAVQAWRVTHQHRLAQAKGRREIFTNYRLRVASVIRDYGMNERAQAPNDSRSVHGE
jgi:heme-degrading monooxygenase HmoA